MLGNKIGSMSKFACGVDSGFDDDRTVEFMVECWLAAMLPVILRRRLEAVPIDGVRGGIGAEEELDENGPMIFADRTDAFI